MGPENRTLPRSRSQVYLRLAATHQTLTCSNQAGWNFRDGHLAKFIICANSRTNPANTLEEGRVIVRA